MAAEIERWVPVRLCCGQQHWDAICPDFMVMCCICFGRFPVSELYVDEAGDRWDVCQPCGKTEEPWRALMTPGPPPLLQVGLRYSFTYHAQPVDIPGKGSFPERFAPGAFDRSLGRVIPLKLEDRQVGHVRVVAADVAPDGASVEFTYEITDLEP